MDAEYRPQDAISEVKALERSGDIDAAERLLLDIIQQMEMEISEAIKRAVPSSKSWAEIAPPGVDVSGIKDTAVLMVPSGVAPWYYERLANLYHKKKDYKSEISILERFAGQKHAPGVKPLRLMERLQKLRR